MREGNGTRAIFEICFPKSDFAEIHAHSISVGSMLGLTSFTWRLVRCGSVL